MNMGSYTDEFTPVSEPVVYPGEALLEEESMQRKRGLDVNLNEISAPSGVNELRTGGNNNAVDARLRVNPAIYPEIPAIPQQGNDFWEVTSAPPLPDLAGNVDDSFGAVTESTSAMFGSDFSSDVAAANAGYGLNLGQDISNVRNPALQQAQRTRSMPRPAINSADPRRQNPANRVPATPAAPKNYNYNKNAHGPGGGNVPPPRNGNNNYNANYGYGTDELTIISRNTVIDGNIRSFANMNIEGDVKGDVETTKNVDLNGKVVGNLTCNNAEMHISQVQGNIHMKGSVEMDRDTLLIGDLVSSYARLNGKIKGNIEINGKAELREDAVVFGDISASTLTVEDGAIIQGFVSTTFLNKEESRNIFPEQVKIGEL
jgi:cytoskeletal protein CcmA (bactofilin family)